MTSKKELQEQLRAIEDAEQREADDKRKRDNFKRFMKRSPDYMVGRAHAELDFINKRYASDRRQRIMPSCVRVSGNVGHDYYPEVDVTGATQTYFHNVWNDAQKNEFQRELNELAYKYITKYAFGLQQRLEMMGLQYLHYYVREEYFLKDDLPKVRLEIERAQDEILDTYSDDDFRNIERKNWVSVDDDGTEETTTKMELYHSDHILNRYLRSKRPQLASELLTNK